MSRTISFQRKMIGCFLAIMLIIFAMGAAGEFALHKLNIQISSAFDYFVPSTDALIQADRDLQQLLVAERTLLKQNLDEVTREKMWQEIATNKLQFEERVNKYQALARSAQEEEVLAKFWEDHKKWEVTMKETSELLKNGSQEAIEAATLISLGRGAEIFESMRERLNILQDYLSERAAIETQNSLNLYRQSSIALGMGILFSIILIFVIYFALVRKIASRLNQFVRELLDVAKSLGHETATVGDSSKHLSSGVSNQASSVDQTVTALDEITAMVARNSETTELSGAVGKECEEEATRGQTIVAHMLRTIEDIGVGNRSLFNDVDHGNREMGRIVEMIRAIEEKTKVIHDIVFQTKLLSFNASVEAARAGEHGKGFAIVAEEVGKLAAVTGSAASEIGELIESSVTQVVDIVTKSQQQLESSIASGDDSLKKGVAAAQQCDEALRSIVEKVNRTNHILDEVNRASREQSAGIREISEAIQNIDLITKENADLAGSTEQVVVELESQSKKLGQVAGELKAIVNGGTSHAS